MRGVVRAERLFVVLLSCGENLVHGGIIFGWPSLVFILIRLGYFSELCDDPAGSNMTTTTTTLMNPTTSASSSPIPGAAGEEVSTCAEQDARFQLVFSVATAAQTVSMFPAGFLFDRFGTRVSRLVLSVLLLAGYVMMGFSSPANSFLVYPGVICFTLAGTVLLLSSMQVGNLFKSHRSTSITLINAMYGMAVILFLVFKAAYEAGFSMNIFFFIMAGSVFLLNINTILLPVKHIPWPVDDEYRLVKACGTRNPGRDKPSTDYVNSGYVDGGVDESGIAAHYVVNGHGVQSRRNGESSIEGEPSRQLDPVATSVPENPPQSDDALQEDRKKREYSTFCSCLTSAPFWLILLWQMILELDMIFTIGTLNTFLTRLAGGVNDLVSWYTDVYSFSQLCILIVGPLGGLLMDRNKIWRSCANKSTSRGHYADMQDSCLPLALTSLASVAYSVCLLIPSLPLQYVTFFFLLILRSMLYGVGSAVVAIVFPMNVFASVYGAMRTASGFFSLLQYPIFILVQNYLDENPFYVTIAFIVADAITLLLPISLYIMAKRGSSKRTNDPIIPVE